MAVEIQTLTGKVTLEDIYTQVLDKVNKSVLDSVRTMGQLDESVKKTGKSLEQPTTAAQFFSKTFNEGLKELNHSSDAAKEHLEQFKEAAESPIGAAKQLVSWFADAVPGALGLTVAAFAAVAVAEFAVAEKFFSFVESAASVGEQLEHFSKKAGVSAEKASELAFAGKALGKDMGAVGDAMFKLNIRVSEGSEDVQKALKDFGLNWKSFADLKPDEQLVSISNAFRALPEDADKGVIAFKLLSRQGKDMLPFLLEPIDELMKKTRSLGMVWGEEEVKQAQDFEIAMNSLKAEFEGLGTTIGRDLLPDFLKLVKMLENSTIIMKGLPAAAHLAAGVFDEVFHVSETVAALTVLEALATKLGLIESPAQRAAAAMDDLAKSMKPVATHASAASESTGRLTDEQKLAKLTAELQENSTYKLSKSVADYVNKALKAGQTTEQISKSLTEQHVVGQEASLSIQELGKSFEKTKSQTEQHAEALKKAQEHMTGASSDVGNLSGYLQAQIEYWHRLGVSAEDIAVHFGVSSAAVSDYIGGLERGEKAAQDWINLHKEMEKATREALAKQTKAVEQAAEAEAHARADQQMTQFKMMKDYSDRLGDLSRSATEINLRNIEKERQAALDAAAGRFGKEGALYDAAAAKINAFYDHQKEKALGTYDTIVERMREAGIQTAVVMQKEAADATRDYEQMKASGLFTAGALQIAWKRMVDANLAVQGIWTQRFVSWIESIPQLLEQALTGGGGLAGFAKALTAEIGGGIGKGLFEEGGLFAGFAKSLQSGTGALSGIFGSTFSKALGFALPGIGAALGSMLGPLVGKIFGMFGENVGHKTAKDLAAGMGGFDEVRKKLNDLGEEGNQLWINFTQRARSADAAKKAWDDITAALDRYNQKQKEVITTSNTQLQGLIQTSAVWKQLPANIQAYIDPLEKAGLLTEANATALRGFGAFGDDAFNRLKSEAESFGVSLDALGPKFKQEGLNKSAKGIINFFDEAIEQGGNYGQLLNGLKEEISGVAQNSIKFGTEIPENMKPWIADLIASGDLLDENGNKITDMNGMTFGAPIKAGLDDVVSKLQELIDIFTKQIPQAVDTVGSSLKNNVVAFDDWRRKAKEATDDVYDGVTAVAVGHSPGGVKQITHELGVASKASSHFARIASANMGKAEDSIDSMYGAFDPMRGKLLDFSAKADINRAVTDATDQGTLDSGDQTTIINLDGEVLTKVVTKRMRKFVGNARATG
jgi:predicted transcriptional regulator